MIEEEDDGGLFASACAGFLVALLTGCWFCYCMNVPKPVFVENRHQQHIDAHQD